MKPIQRMVIASVVVAIGVALAVAIPTYYSHDSKSQPPVRAGNIWGELNDYGVGLANAVILGPVTIPTGYSPVYVQGNISTLSWQRYEGGSGNLTGNCSAPTPEAGVCDVYVGVWTPAAWATYASGGSATPLWCYSNGGSGCTNASTFGFTSSDLSSSDGAPWEVVLWNLVPWGLYGYFNVTEYQGTGAPLS
jgi:hypothetical protein